MEVSLSYVYVYVYVYVNQNEKKVKKTFNKIILNWFWSLRYVGEADLGIINGGFVRGDREYEKGQRFRFVFNNFIDSQIILRISIFIL